MCGVAKAKHGGRIYATVSAQIGGRWVKVAICCGKLKLALQVHISDVDGREELTENARAIALLAAPLKIHCHTGLRLHEHGLSHAGFFHGIQRWRWLGC